MRSLRFNQGFSLDRALIRGMLQYIANHEQASDEAIAGYIGVNPYKVEGLRGWFCKLGLGSGSSKQQRLSPFGALIASSDPDMSRAGTLWMLHYFLATEHEERSEVWHQCFNQFLHPAMVFAPEELQEHIERNLPESPANKTGIDKDVKELIKTYTQTSALGQLALLMRQKDKKIVAGISAQPELLIVAYALFNTWQRRYNETNTLRLSQLVTEAETPGRIFVSTAEQVRDMVLRLQAQGLLTYADTQHEPVTRRFHDEPLTLLEQYYQR
jgi:hypothetical protein